MRFSPRSSWLLALTFAAFVSPFSMARAQMPTTQPSEMWQHYVIDRELASALWIGTDTWESAPTSRTPRIRMFGMLPGFLSEPAELTAFDDPADSIGSGSSEMRGFVLSLGDDNPLFDPRRPGNVGGTGFYRVHSQYQVLDWGSTSVCLGLQAWAPAGLECGGAQEGPTVFSPGVGIFHDLGDGSALHGYVGQNFHGRCKDGPLNCSMAWHCPVSIWDEQDNSGLFFFVQALGRLDYGSDRQGRPMNVEVVPGLHWRLSDSFWMSLGASRSGMLTCRWQF